MHSSAPVQTLPLLGARLRKLAESVRSIGYPQNNPERILSAKQEIAAEMEKLATLVEGGPR